MASSRWAGRGKGEAVPARAATSGEASAGWLEHPGYPRLAGVLQAPRWELAPIKDPRGAAAALPPRATVTIGCFATSDAGFEVTRELTARLTRERHFVVPHFPARSVRDAAHLHDLLDGLRETGCTDVFVVAGNAGTPVGPYQGALEILPEVAAHGFTTGVAAYPEGHPFLDEPAAFELLRRKQEHASYLVTQTCFDADVVSGWLRRARRAGVALPAHLGVAGVITRMELLRVATWMGIGKSIRFIGMQPKLASRLVSPGAYDPTALVTGLVEAILDPECDVVGLHLNTFNQVASTRQWWEGLAAELGVAPEVV